MSFAVLGYLTDTAMKNRQNILNALSVIAELKFTD
jgi:hypothetical protein